MYVPDAADIADTTEEATNIGLIAGASVGGVVVIGIIAFAVYKYRKSKEGVMVEDVSKQEKQNLAEVEVIGDNYIQEGPSNMKISPEQ